MKSEIRPGKFLLFPLRSAIEDQQLACPFLEYDRLAHDGLSSGTPMIFNPTIGMVWIR